MRLNRIIGIGPAGVNPAAPPASPRVVNVLANHTTVDHSAREPGRPLVGRRFGPYTVLMPLGAATMGDVYRARDERLGRDVALKVLPPHVSSDPDRRARFETEARMLAALNHPHIGAIYGLEHVNGGDALVLRLRLRPRSSWRRPIRTRLLHT